jgi:hypothetical protein
MPPRQRLARALIAAVVVFVTAVPAFAAERVKPVVELFTSQGCSSCPPADAFLAKLAARGDVIALSEHVDYWNYIGWVDPFSDAGGTDRQRAYRAALGGKYVYTPQMVIDGAAETVGSDGGAVEKRIAAARARPHAALEVARVEGSPIVRIPAGQDFAKGALVIQFDIDARHSTRIARGENSGVTLVNANVVRKIAPRGSYTGAALDVPLDAAKLRADGRSGAVVMLQAPDGGRIFGAVLVNIAEGS